MLERLKGRKYLSHSYNYKVDGEDLPEKDNKVNKKALFISTIATFLAFLAVNYLFVSYAKVIATLSSLDGVSLLDIADQDYGDSFRITNAFSFSFSLQIYFVLLAVMALLTVFIYSKLNYKSEDEIAYGQKGDSRFTTIEEIQEQYPSIPEKGKSFKGVGGIPISHYKDKYFIDVDTVNTCILGVSRSGKGEMIITPMIDNLSRAEVKSSMVLNDPKGELYAGSKDTLEKRGYDVQVLNLQDPLQSMSYNPLQLVKEAWLQGNEQEAGKIANSISFSLYNNPNAGENAWAYQGAQNAVTAIMIALVEYCVKMNTPEKITMPNVTDMLNELGAFYYKENEDDFVEKNALDEFFKSLPQGHVAKKRYGSTSFSGEKARGTILSTANEGLQPFVDSVFAKMTSKNSIDLKQVGFPKHLIGQLNQSLMNKRVDITFHENNKEKTLIGKHRVKVKSEGMYSLNFSDKLKNGDLVLIKYQDSEQSYRLIYQLEFKEETDKDGNIIYQKKEGAEHLPELSRSVQIKELVNTFPEVKKDLQMKYSDKPTAVFMIIPDYDSSNHTLASIFTKQLYTELATNCAETKGNKCFVRVQFILDEFGNMPPIDDMDQVMTVCLGRNILFNLVVQSYSQIKRKYGEGSETIKENCQNHIYIMSTNEDTIEELSKKAGHKTLVTQSSSEKHMDADNSINKSADQERIITFDRLSQLIEGETLVIRSLKRQDNKRRKIRPYPIFNTRETNMPYRWQFLTNWLDTSKDLNDIDIHSEHSGLDLKDLDVNFSEFIVDDQARKKYIQSMQKLNERSERHKKENEIQKQERTKESAELTVIKEIETLISKPKRPDPVYPLLKKMVNKYMRVHVLPSNKEIQEIIGKVFDPELTLKLRELMKVRES